MMIRVVDIMERFLSLYRNKDLIVFEDFDIES